ncbi:flagellin [Tropicibacter oceani]|uniref:Flagellin n=1 Tax=Tropicibacter oceani TaxID=3058420 RepID=A0ABY8QJ25_9RHOB|nr:flagellin [Tropicibacter oceani]WGW04634.1 flagellin [Tropicibacter oceani]
MDSVGNLARSLVLRTNQVRLREEMDKLAVEVSTGLTKDTGKHLGGDLTGLMAIDRSLSKLDAYRVNTTEAAYLTSTMQTTLDEMQTRTQTLSGTLIAADLTTSGELLSTMSEDAKSAMGQVLNGMNRSVAGRFLFSGTATDRAAVAGLDEMMIELRTAVAGQTDLAGIEAALDVFFDAGGTFETTIYQGSATGLAPMRLSENETASVDIRATDPVFRELLKPLAMAALAADGTLGLDSTVQSELLATAGRDLLGAQKPLVELRAGLGSLEARIEETQTRNSAERTATSLAKLDLVGTDQYETAARYETIRSQLESLYTITARSQRLSLAEYL